MTGSVLFSELLPRYSAMSKFDAVFFIDSDSVTLAAANATKSAAGTIKLINGFYNPLGSGFDCHIISANVSTVSGTPAGPYFFNAQTLGAVSLTNAATGKIWAGPLNTINQGQTTFVLPNNQTIFAEVNVALVRSDAATTAFSQVWTLGGPAAIAAGAGEYDCDKEIAGRIIVPPGCVFGITATGAGTTHIVQSTLAVGVVAI
jgi:hypothetical protein